MDEPSDPYDHEDPLDPQEVDPTEYNIEYSIYVIEEFDYEMLIGQFVKATEKLWDIRNRDQWYRMIHIDDTKRLNDKFNLFGMIEEDSDVEIRDGVLFIPAEWLEGIEIPDSLGADDL